MRVVGIGHGISGWVLPMVFFSPWDKFCEGATKIGGVEMAKKSKTKVLVVLQVEYADVVNSQTIACRGSQYRFNYLLGDLGDDIRRLMSAYPYILVRIPSKPEKGQKYTVPKGSAWCNDGTGDDVYITMSQAIEAIAKRA